MPGERRGGRQGGTPNKIPKALKEMILEALDRAGGVDYLQQQAVENAPAFLTLVGKVLPKDVRAEVKPSENLALQVVLVQPKRQPEDQERRLRRPWIGTTGWGRLKR